MNNSQPSKFINLSLAFLWGYQGLIPKILFINPDEITIWQTFGLPMHRPNWQVRAQVCLSVYLLYCSYLIQVNICITSVSLAWCFYSHWSLF